MAIENFTTYTEEDDNNKLTVTAPKALGEDVDRDEDVYLYKDKTADHFNALDVDFEILISSTSLRDGLGGVAVSNTIDSGSGFAATDCLILFQKTHTGAPDYFDAYKLSLYRGAALASDNYVGAADTLYYCTLSRAAGNDTVSLLIYSDSGRTDLLDTLAVAGFGTVKWQYVYGFVAWNMAVGDKDFDGYVQNLDLNEVAGLSIPVAMHHYKMMRS